MLNVQEPAPCNARETEMKLGVYILALGVIAAGVLDRAVLK